VPCIDTKIKISSNFSRLDEGLNGLIGIAVNIGVGLAVGLVVWWLPKLGRRARARFSTA